MRAVAIVLLCSGCEVIFGIGDTKLQPDAPPRPIVNPGSGRDGQLVVGTTTFTDETRTNLAMAVGKNSTLLSLVSTDGLSVGDEVLVIQMTGADGGNSDTGKIVSMSGKTITIDYPLQHSYMPDADNVVQVLEVPNYSDVTVPTGARLTAHPFDGAVGGVLFFRASGTVRIADGGIINAPGGQGGAAGTSAPASEGGFGGAAGGRVACPLDFCAGNLFAGTGGDGQEGPGNLGQPGVVHEKCRAGNGGRGGIGGPLTISPGLASPGVGPGGAIVASGGGVYASADSAHPLIGGGGAGGNGVSGGRGGAGGGGGGGSVSNTLSSSGEPGTAGEPGGAPGTSGNGGTGGGIVWIHATEIQIDGTISVDGTDGGAPSNGLDGGIGGDGGESGGGVPCYNVNIYGGAGAGGAGGSGGDGGNGGGGGAAGTMIIEAFTVRTGGSLTARGGRGTVASVGGQPGMGGMGFGGQAPSGNAGANGAGGTGGDNGRLYIFFVEACTGCVGAGDPAAIVMER